MPETVQIDGVSEVRVTARPDEAEAVAVILPRPRVRAVVDRDRLIVCPWRTAKSCVAVGAGLYVASPACAALMVQVPAAMPVTVVPLIEQVEGVVAVKATDKPDEAVAMTDPVPPMVRFGATPNVIV